VRRIGQALRIESAPIRAVVIYRRSIGT